MGLVPSTQMGGSETTSRAERMRDRYQNDPDFRERQKASSRAYHARKLEERRAAGETIAGKGRPQKRTENVSGV